MIEGIKAYPVLAGMRGEEPVDLSLIEESLLRLSQLVSDFVGELEEFDLNPLIVTRRRDRSFVVDARVLLRERDGRPERRRGSR
jgi:acyl-CoA synthetase (NDP forming)